MFVLENYFTPSKYHGNDLFIDKINEIKIYCGKLSCGKTIFELNIEERNKALSYDPRHIGMHLLEVWMKKGLKTKGKKKKNVEYKFRSHRALPNAYS